MEIAFYLSVLEDSHHGGENDCYKLYCEDLDEAVDTSEVESFKFLPGGLVLALQAEPVVCIGAAVPLAAIKFLW